MLKRFIGRNRDFSAAAAATPAQSRALHANLALGQADLTLLAPVPDDRPAALAPMRRARYLHRRQLQHRFDCCAPAYVDQFLQGQLGALNQFHQRQKPLPVFRQPARQRPPVVAANNLIVLPHGGSLLQTSTRFYENRARPTAILFQVPTSTETPPAAA